MSRKLWCLTLCLMMMGMIAAPEAWAQRRWGLPPQIGYVFPAGARQGETVEVTVGGQRLAKATEVRLSGEGIQTTLIDYTDIGDYVQEGLFRISISALAV